MLNMDAVPVRDWIALALAAAGLVVAELQSRGRLPGWARRWLSRLGQERIEQAIEHAARLEGLSPEDRRREAADYLVRLAERELGITLPRSIANLLVEYVYQFWRRRRHAAAVS